MEEAEDVINSFLQIDPNSIYKTLDKHGITVYEGGSIEPHTCNITSQQIIKTNFLIYETKMTNANYLSDHIIEVNREKTIRPRHTEHTIHSSVWTKTLQCLGLAERNGRRMIITGLTNITLTTRTTNQRINRICNEGVGSYETICISGQEFNTRANLEGTLTLGNGTTVHCIYESPHPDTVFKAKGRQITLSHLDEPDNKIRALNKTKVSTAAISFKSQKESLDSLKQMIRIITPQSDTQSYSMIDHTFLLYYAATGMTILAIIRLAELTWILTTRRTTP